MSNTFDEEYYVIMRENNDYYPAISGRLIPESKFSKNRRKQQL